MDTKTTTIKWKDILEEQPKHSCYIYFIAGHEYMGFAYWTKEDGFTNGALAVEDWDVSFSDDPDYLNGYVRHWAEWEPFPENPR